MRNDNNIEERIDNYLLGRMSEDEKRAFETDVESDVQLKEEFDAQRTIADSVQRVALHDFLQECEAKIASKPQIQVVGLRDTFNTLKTKLSEFTSSGKRVVWSLSSVAAAVMAIIGGINYSGMSHSVQTIASTVYVASEISYVRDGNQIWALLDSAYELIGTDNLDLAEETLATITTELQSIIDKPIVTDDDRVDYEEAQECLQDAEWYSTIILMKEGKVFKTKKALKKIAAEGGIHSAEAKDILINTYNIKQISKQ